MHASPNAPVVDVAVTDGPVLFDNVAFGEFAEYIQVPGGTYDLEVNLAGTGTTVLPLRDIAVEPGTVYTVYALGLVGGKPELQAGIAQDFQAPARVRIAHASPDAPEVDVFVDGMLAFDDVAFTGVTEYAALPGGTYNVQVAAAADNNLVVIDEDLMLEPAREYTVVAIDTLANIQPLVLIDDNTLLPTETRLRFVHASPNAPAVDIALMNGPVLISDVSFGEASRYITVQPGTYDLEVRVAGTSTVALMLPGVSVGPNTTYTAFAEGLLGQQPPLQAVLVADAIGLLGEINGDNCINHTDIALLLGTWGSPGCDGDDPCLTDLNGDGSVGPFDLAILLNNWTG